MRSAWIGHVADGRKERHRLLTEIRQEGRFGMKKLSQLVIMCFTVLMLSACGTGGGESDEGVCEEGM